jgi:hypothetical protein
MAPMRRTVFVCFAAWVAVLTSTAGHPLASPKPEQTPSPAPVQPVAASKPVGQPVQDHATLLKQYCITCHNERLKTAGLALDAVSLTDIPAGAEVWEKVIRKLRAGMMPPVGVPRPDQGALDNLATHLETTLDKAALAAPVLRGPTMHRLNRAEYGNAIRDLFALQLDVSSLLPSDEEAFGFDNNASVLNVSTSLMDRYLSAAWKISAQAVASPAITPALETFRVRGDLSQHDHVPGLPVGTRGGIVVRHYFPVDGEYVISPRLYRETVNIIRGLELEHDLEVTLDGERVVLARFGGPKDEQANYLQPTLAGDEMEKRFQKRLKVTAGPHEVGVSFIKKSSATTLELLQPFERERIDPITPVGIPELDRVTVEGPFNPVKSDTSPSRKRIFTCTPASERDATACARTILSTVARRAYRGPVSRNGDDAVARLLRERTCAWRQLRSGNRERADVPPGQPAIPLSDRAGSCQCRRRGLVSRQRHRDGVALIILSLEQHPGRRTARPRSSRPPARARGSRAAGSPHAQGRTVAGAGK